MSSSACLVQRCNPLQCAMQCVQYVGSVQYLEGEALDFGQQPGGSFQGILAAEEVGAIQLRVGCKVPQDALKVLLQRLGGVRLQVLKLRKEACSYSDVCVCLLPDAASRFPSWAPQTARDFNLRCMLCAKGENNDLTF